MAIKRGKKVKDDGLFPGELDEEFADDTRVVSAKAAPVARTAPAGVKAVHIEPSEIISSLNNAVSGINAVFQARDSLVAEVAELKNELAIAKDVRVERARIEDLKREQENFEYDFKLRKERMENELERFEEERREKIGRMEEEARDKIKADADDQAAKIKNQVVEQALKLKTEREDHERKIKLEREDFDRAKNIFELEKVAFDTNLKNFEAEKAAMRDRLVSELNRDNEHQIKLNSLNHQREVEILKSQLKLEQANAGKFEGLLTDSRAQNEKLSEQLSTLSREALASASSSSMAVKLKEIISQMNPQGSQNRG